MGQLRKDDDKMKKNADRLEERAWERRPVVSTWSWIFIGANGIGHSGYSTGEILCILKELHSGQVLLCILRKRLVEISEENLFLKLSLMLGLKETVDACSWWVWELAELIFCTRDLKILFLQINVYLNVFSTTVVVVIIMPLIPQVFCFFLPGL